MSTTDIGIMIGVAAFYGGCWLFLVTCARNAVLDPYDNEPAPPIMNRASHRRTRSGAEPAGGLNTPRPFYSLHRQVRQDSTQGNANVLPTIGADLSGSGALSSHAYQYEEESGGNVRKVNGEIRNV